MLEVGAKGGRTGLRTVDEAVAVAEQIETLGGGYLQLAGIEAFEGIFGGTPREAETHVASFMEHVSEVARRCDGVFSVDEVVLTAGGSAFFDQVVKALKGIPLVEVPPTDPVMGEDGPLVRLWRG